MEIGPKIPRGETVEKFFSDEISREIRFDFIGRVVTIIIASLSLIAALAWEDALHELYLEFVKDADTFGAKIIFASIVTLFAVIISVILGKMFLRKAKKIEER